MHGSETIQVVTRKVAGETALALEDRGAVVLFGLGPPAGSLPPPQRAAVILDGLGSPLRSIRWARQIHGATVLAVDEDAGDAVTCAGDADGLLTHRTSCGLLVWTADCVPVTLVGPRVVAIVHAGWRGAAAGIVPAAVRRIAEAGAPTGQLLALLGPAISSRHYQVGPEVIEALARTGVPQPAWLDGDRVDLRGFLAAQLAGLGVAAHIVGPCTYSSPELASWRRDGAAAGRQWSLVWRT